VVEAENSEQLLIRARKNIRTVLAMSWQSATRFMINMCYVLKWNRAEDGISWTSRQL